MCVRYTLRYESSSTQSTVGIQPSVPKVANFLVLVNLRYHLIKSEFTFSLRKFELPVGRPPSRWMESVTSSFTPDGERLTSPISCRISSKTAFLRVKSFTSTNQLLCWLLVLDECKYIERSNVSSPEKKIEKYKCYVINQLEQIFWANIVSKCLGK